jgi:hypothetical protein
VQSRGPTLIINPPSDVAFGAFAHEQLRAGATTAAALGAALRSKYPKTEVRERALAGELTPTWYVYRDGTWVRGD